MEENKNEFILAYCSAVLLTNDLKYIHINGCGNHFDRIHSITDEYYWRSNGESDYLMELCMENSINIINPTLANTYLKDWKPECDHNYTFETAMVKIKEKITLYIESLEMLRDSMTQSDTQSWLDDTIRYWKKESGYKMERRMTPKINIQQFIDKGSDTITMNFVKNLQSQDNFLDWD